MVGSSDDQWIDPTTFKQEGSRKTKTTHKKNRQTGSLLLLLLPGQVLAV